MKTDSPIGASIKIATIFCISCWILYSCKTDKEESPPRQFHSWTRDVFDIDSMRYLVDRSPLKGLGGYEMLFFMESPMVLYMRESDAPWPRMLTLFGEWDKAYSCVWIISDSMLYLKYINSVDDIDVVGHDNVFGDKKSRTEHIYPMKDFLMEKHAIDPHTPYNRTPIAATWVTGTFYVKDSYDNRLHLIDREEYDRLPFTGLEFQNGKLVSSREIASQPITEEDRRIYAKMQQRFCRQREPVARMRKMKAEERVRAYKKKTEMQRGKPAKTGGR